MWYSSLLLKTPAIAEKKIHHVNVQDNHFFSRKAKGPEENNFIISTFKRLGVNLHAKLRWFGWAFFFFYRTNSHLFSLQMLSKSLYELSPWIKPGTYQFNELDKQLYHQCPLSSHSQ